MIVKLLQDCIIGGKNYVSGSTVTVTDSYGGGLISSGKAELFASGTERNHWNEAYSWGDHALVGYSTSSGPISLTSTELSDLIMAEGIITGQTYVVTDKGWILTGTGVATLGGSITIMNGETLPAGVEPERLWIDTGTIDWDISYDTGTPYSITPIDSYVPINYITKSIGGVIENITFYDTNGDQPFNNNADSIPDVVKYYIPVQPESCFHIIELVATGCSEWIKFQVIMELVRSQLYISFPITTLSTPETSTDGTTTTLPFDTPMQNPIDYLSDFTLTVNSSPATITSVALDVDPTRFIITPETPLVYGDVATLSIYSGNIKNTWGGVLAAVTDQPITNNVPEPV